MLSKRRQEERGYTRLDKIGRRKAPKGRGGGRLVSGSLVHTMDLGRAPEEMVVVMIHPNFSHPFLSLL